ncbi:MAG: polysaccharide biosynthesis/export family protein [Planctomycetes bacterium]|nr:polysaccharide biosynthesis/export family protein [Planctomycetota bacterium]
MPRTAFLVALLVAVAAAPARAQDALPPPRNPSGVGGTPVAPPSPTPRPIPPPTGTEAPRTGLAMPTDYRLAPGDEIEVEVALPKAVEEATTNPFRDGRRFIVAPGGRLSVPKVKDVDLVGRTVAEVQRDVEQRLREGGVAATADVFVRVTAYAPRFVHLVGAVYRKIEISPFQRANLLVVLAEAGEAMKDVDLRSIQVVSPGASSRRVVNFRSVLAAGGTGPDATLDPGDILILERDEKVAPPTPVVYIFGAVAKPGPYLLQEPGRSNQPITVTQLFAAAGGGTQYADIDEVVIRRVRGEPAVQRVDVKRILRNQAPDVALVQDDIVFVPES